MISGLRSSGGGYPSESEGRNVLRRLPDVGCGHDGCVCSRLYPGSGS